MRRRLYSKRKVNEYQQCFWTSDMTYDSKIKIKVFKSHYLRASDSLNYGLEIEKKTDLIEIDFVLPIFNFCREMNQNAYIF